MKTESFPADCIPVTLDALAYGGDAVGRIGEQVVFVPGGVPGDHALIRITGGKKSFLRGLIESLEEPSPDRVEPFCPHEDRCGGCQWQQVSYEAQLTWKRRIVEESLRRIARIDDTPVEPCVPSFQNRWYRSVARFPLGIQDGRLVMGYYARKSNTIVDIDHCPVLTSRADALFTGIRGLLSSATPLPPVAEVTVQASQYHPSAFVDILLTRAHDMSSVAEKLLNSFPDGTGIFVRLEGKQGMKKFLKRYGEPARFEELGDARFRISGSAFFQVNIPQTERLVSLIRELLAGETTDTVVDGYGGVGLFSFTVFSDDTRITLFDIDRRAVADSRSNADMNGYRHFSAIAGNAADALAQCPKPDVVILDPPRTGLGRRVITEVATHQVPVIVCVSCNPATLARDLSIFREQGYHIERIMPLDMFPQTFHIETVVKLRRGE
ncbi:23S rRNA (uracil(1939)-C(5))-methyltransferase RlmD [Candidatus Latescibacterota bacterium]